MKAPAFYMWLPRGPGSIYIYWDTPDSILEVWR